MGENERNKTTTLSNLTEKPNLHTNTLSSHEPNNALYHLRFRTKAAVYLINLWLVSCKNIISQKCYVDAFAVMASKQSVGSIWERLGIFLSFVWDFGSIVWLRIEILQSYTSLSRKNFVIKINFQVFLFYIFSIYCVICFQNILKVYK